MDEPIIFDAVDFNRCRSNLARTLVADNGAFPIRVIVVNDTLSSNGGIVFTEPKDWGFHTISHRWSMQIEELSFDIGSKLKEHAESSNIGPYNDAFKGAKLGGRPGYDHLLEFLQILQEDGVERVWFDTLCINQVDEKEKSREILHMGAFYFHSLGCYVNAHGFGRGFGILDDDGHSPQWFSRVWTFPEFLLPKMLSFVVELSLESFQNTVSKVRRNHLTANCVCQGETGELSSVWPWGSADTGMLPIRLRLNSEKIEGVDEMEFWRLLESSNYKCTNGRIKRIEMKKCMKKKKWLYLVDRGAYDYLLRRTRDKNKQEGRLKAEVRELLTRFEMVINQGHPGVVKEISLRNCSNEEDRVLAVLGLLGLGGNSNMKQLRTGRTLEEQIVAMGKAMAHCSIHDLMRLCVSFVRPYPMPGLSWAPHFVAIPSDCHLLGLEWGKDNPEQGALDPYEEFHHSIARVSVSPNGLTLSCYTLKGTLVPFHKHTQKCIGGGGATLLNSKQACFSCNTQDAPSWVLEISHGHALPFYSHLTSHGELVLLSSFWPNWKLDTTTQVWQKVATPYFIGGLVLGLHTPIPNMMGGALLDTLEGLQPNLWMLLLGTASLHYEGVDERVVHVFIVCVGESKENLHKIGMVKMLPTYTRFNGHGTSIIHGDSFHNMECTIGGYGKKISTSWVANQIGSL